MIEITCCRTGVHPKINYGIKGAFKHRFKDLSSLALWIHKAGRKLFYPNLRNELTKKQRMVLPEKLCALYRIDHYIT